MANARLPTEKAHGHAIVKMCQAYAQAGLDVELWHPFRHQDDRRMASTTVFDYYGVPEIFGVRTLLNVDVIHVEPWCPKSVYPFVLGAHDVAWAWYASQLVRRRAPDICHTRDPTLAYSLVRAKVPTLLEVHDPPSGPRRRLVQQIANRPALRGVIALTDACREVLASFDVPESKTIVLGSCVDLAPYLALPSRDECRLSLGLPRDRQIIGYVGRFEALGSHKGLSTLIEAAGVLRREHGLSPFVLCVGGPMTVVPHLVETARASGVELDHLRFVDHVPNVEVPAWIRGATSVCSRRRGVTTWRGSAHRSKCSSSWPRACRWLRQTCQPYARSSRTTKTRG